MGCGGTEQKVMKRRNGVRPRRSGLEKRAPPTSLASLAEDFGSQQAQIFHRAIAPIFRPGSEHLEWDVTTGEAGVGSLYLTLLRTGGQGQASSPQKHSVSG